MNKKVEQEFHQALRNRELELVEEIEELKADLKAEIENQELNGRIYMQDIQRVMKTNRLLEDVIRKLIYDCSEDPIREDD
jgi:hypothetical protein